MASPADILGKAMLLLRLLPCTVASGVSTASLSSREGSEKGSTTSEPDEVATALAGLTSWVCMCVTIMFSCYCSGVSS